MDLVAEITDLIQHIAEQHGAFIVDLGVRGTKGNRIIEIFLDTPTGITTVECSAISKEVAKEFDSRNLIDGRYHLVVSSPGADRPMKLPRQYPKHIGRMVHLTIRNGGIVETIEGKLVEATEAALIIESADHKRREINFSVIDSGNVCLPW